jgi:hypothetical protein
MSLITRPGRPTVGESLVHVDGLTDVVVSVGHTLGQDGCGVAEQRDVGQVNHGKARHGGGRDHDYVVSPQPDFEDPTLRQALIATWPCIVVEANTHPASRSISF